MKVIDLVGYMIIGGVVMGFADRKSMNECGSHIPFTDLTTGVIAWPGALTAAMITITDGNLCEDSQKNTPDVDNTEN